MEIPQKFSEVGTAILATKQGVSSLGDAMLGMSEKQMVAVIATKKLNVAQAQQALTAAKVKAAQQEQILAKAGLTVTSKGLTTAISKETAAKVLNTKADLAAQGVDEKTIKLRMVQILKTQGLTSAQALQAVNTVFLTGANKGLLVSIKAVTAGLAAQAKIWAMTPMGKVAIAVAAIAGIGTALHRLATSSQRAIDTSNELADTYRSLQQTMNQTASSARDAAAAFDSLSGGTDQLGRNVSLTAEEYEQFISANNELAQQFEDLERTYDSQGNAIVRLTGDVQNMTEAVEELIRAQQVQAAIEWLEDHGDDFMEGRMAQLRAYRREIASLNAALNETFNFGILDDYGNVRIDSLQMIRQHGGRVEAELEFYASIPEQELLQEIADLEQTVENFLATQFSPYVESALTINPYFEFLGDNQQNLIRRILGTVPWDRIEYTFQEVVDSIVESLSDPAIEEAWSRLLSFDMNQDANTIQREITSLINTISEISGIDPVKIAAVLDFDPDEIHRLNREMLGLLGEDMRGLREDSSLTDALASVFDLDQLREVYSILLDIDNIGDRRAFARSLTEGFMETIDSIKDEYNNFEINMAEANERIAQAIKDAFDGEIDYEQFQALLEIFKLMAPSAETAVSAATAQFNRLREEAEKIQAIIDRLRSGEALSQSEIMDLVDAGTIDMLDVVRNADGFMTVPVEVFGAALAEMEDKWEQYLHDQKYALQTAIHDIEEQIAELGDIDDDDINIALFEVLNEQLNRYIDNLSRLQNFGDLVPEGHIKQLEAFEYAMFRLSVATNDVEWEHWSNRAQTAFNGLKGAVLDGTLSFEEYIKKQRQLENATMSVAEQINILESSYRTLQNALEEYNEHGNITLGTFKNLLDLSPEFIGALDLQAGQLHLNTDLAYQLADALLEQALMNLQASFASEVLALAQGNVADGARNAVEPLGAAGNAAKEAGANASKGAEGWREYGMAKLMALGIDADGDIDGLDALVARYARIEENMRNLRGAVSGARSLGGGSRGGGAAREIELIYIEVDKLHKLVQQLFDAQTERRLLETQRQLTDDLDERARIAERILETKREEMEILQEMTRVRNRMIDEYVNELRDAGFVVRWNADQNQLLIENLEHVNDIKGDCVETTNELRQAYDGIEITVHPIQP